MAHGGEVAVTTLGPGTQLGHYTILRSLGSGGMADVYEAQDSTLDRHVALKVLPIEYSRNPQLVQRFQKEVRAAAKLNHRNIVTVFEVGQQDMYHFFSMRLLPGGDLRKRIQQGLSPVESLAILRELADAFAHAHARGFVHRDVKPENVMFDEQGFPVLTDFGIAKALDANTHMTRTGMTMGTPRYLSPEQASGKPVDARADLYSLGVMFFEMLTGRAPYDAEEPMAVIFKHVTEPIPVLPPEVLRYQPLLERLMAKNADDRIGSAAELISEIDALAPEVGAGVGAAGTGEVKQSQVRTAANPLLGGLLTPSPLRTAAPRTPAPKTPRPVTPPPAEEELPTGEVIVRPARATSPPRRPTAPPARPRVEPAAEAPAEAAEVAAPTAARSRTGLLAIGGGLAAVALAGVAFLALRPSPPATTAPATAVPSPAPVAAAPADAAKAEAARRAQAERAQAEKEKQEQQQKEAAAQAARRQADEQARTEALARQRADEEAARKQAAERTAREQAEARRRAEAQEARRVAEQEAAARKAAEAEERRRARESAAAAAPAPATKAAAARLTVVNDCRQIVELVRVDADGKSQPSGTLSPSMETSIDSYVSAKWRIFEKSRRRPLLKELTLTEREQQLLVCNTAEAEKAEEEEAKERARRPTGF